MTAHTLPAQAGTERGIRRVTFDEQAWEQIMPSQGALAVFDGDEMIAIVFGADEQQEMSRARLTAIAPEMANVTAAVARLHKTDRIAAAHGLGPLIRKAQETYEAVIGAPPTAPHEEGEPAEAGDLHACDCAFWKGVGCDCF